MSSRQVLGREGQRLEWLSSELSPSGGTRELRWCGRVTSCAGAVLGGPSLVHMHTSPCGAFLLTHMFAVAVRGYFYLVRP